MSKIFSGRRPSSVGMLALKRFLLNTSTWSAVSKPNSVGRSPERSFELTSKNVSEVSRPTSVGKLPVSALLGSVSLSGKPLGLHAMPYQGRVILQGSSESLYDKSA